MPTDYSWFPTDLAWLRDRLIATERDCLDLTVTDRAPATAWGSQLGGRPYLVGEHDFPHDDNGAQMAFLIQLDFAELPPLDGFPAEGLLQFSVGTDDVFGMRFGEGPDQFHVRYHPTVDTTWQPDPGWTPDYDWYCSPLFHTERLPLSVVASRDRMPVLPPDDRFLELIGDKDIDEVDLADIEQSGNRIGGYPWFRQNDDREPEKDILLLQLCSADITEAGFLTDWSVPIMEWGDGGTAQFFISADDLADREFGNVQYTWACG